MPKKLSTFRNKDFFNFNFKQSQKSGKGVTEEVIRSTADVIVAIDGTGDFEELQEAINEVSSTGGYIQVKEGTFNLKSTINLTSNIRIEGVGENTIFTTNDTIGTMFYSNNNENITIENLQIDGNNISNITGIRLDKEFMKIRNCYIHNCNIGIQSKVIFDLVITNNRFMENEESIIVDGLGNAGIISNNSFLYDSGGTLAISVGKNDSSLSLLISNNNFFYGEAIRIVNGDGILISSNLIENGDITLTTNGNNNAVYVNIITGSGSIVDNGTGNTTTPNKT